MLRFFLFFLLFPSLLAVRSSRRILEDNALISIIAAFTDDSQVFLSSWNSSTDHCTWVGVTCDSYHVTALNLSGLNLTGTISADIGRLQHLSKLDFSHNSFSGFIPREISVCKSLTYLDLSSNQLIGEIPNEITSMKMLNYLNLSRNYLVGGIPDSLLAIHSLTSVDFSYNNLSGLVPGTADHFNSTSFLGNPNLCGGPYFGPCKDGNVPPHSVLEWCLFIGCMMLFLVILGPGLYLSVACCWLVRNFDYYDLTTYDVMSCLKKDNIIGEGAAGFVYKGNGYTSGKQFAVKRLPVKTYNHFNYHGMTSKMIRTLGKTRNLNVVRLLGTCSDFWTIYLLYDYMPNGSLGNLLHGGIQRGVGLPWDTRYKIVVEAARGLRYLHHDCSPLIVHGNVKSNNILLDTDFNARVTDFGFAKLLKDSRTSTIVATGSNGYIAPEYEHTGKVDEKSDVYSFGVVLLELVSGKKPVGEFGEGVVDIVQWVRNLTEGKKEEVLKILDPRLTTDAPLNEVMHVFNVAMLCVEDEADKRPTMLSVVQILTELRKDDEFQLKLLTILDSF